MLLLWWPLSRPHMTRKNTRMRKFKAALRWETALASKALLILRVGIVSYLLAGQV